MLLLLLPLPLLLQWHRLGRLRLAGRDVTSLQKDASSVFSATSYRTDSDETIQGRNEW